MRSLAKVLVSVLAATSLSSAIAGSYDDFFTAIKRDTPGVVQRLLQRGFDPNTPSPDGSPGLFLALRDASLKVAEVLLEAPQTDVDPRTRDDETPLMMAALRGEADIARRLVARGADVNKPGWTPLHYAATGGHAAIIEMLLAESAYIDAESPNGTTPLMMAAQYGSTEAVRMLLEAGADPTLRNKLGQTALDFATRGSRPDAIKMLTEQLRRTPSRGTW